MQRRVAVFAVAAVLGSPPAATAEAAPDAPDAPDAAAPLHPWSPPVDGPVVHPFRPAVNAYGAGGHAGLDYGAPAGTTVRATGRGVVSFTGQVAGAVFVVIAHGHDLRTTYAPMHSVRVRRGQEVEKGDALGTLADRGMQGHGPGLLHFGLRQGDTPVDPARLFGAVDLTRTVRLVPADDLDALTLGSLQAERSRVSRWVRGAASRVGDFLGRDGIAPPLAARVSLSTALGLARGVADWATQGPCTPEAEADARVPGTAARPRTGRHLVAVGGLNSSWEPGEPAPFALAVSDLGYVPGETTAFSYAPGGGAYRPPDTHVGPRVAAARLAAQLASHARRHPGQAVDLIGHSQGGVVVEAFLKLHYREHPDEYPPIGAVVTLAAPHRGAPLASTVRRLTANPFLRAVFDAAGGWSESVPAPTSGSVRDLDPEGPLVDRLRSIPLPAGIRMTTLAGVDDVVVPATRTKVDGADHVVVDPDGWHDHSAIVSDRRAVMATALALAGAPSLCTGLADSVRARVEPRLVEGVTP